MRPDIYCTLGTTTDDQEILEGMVDAGMRGARMNTAYATIDEYQQRLDMVRDTAPVRMMMDLKGPEVRLYADGAREFREGDRFTIGDYDGALRFSKDCVRDLAIHDTVLFENGTIEGWVVDKGEEALEVQMLSPAEGYLSSSMGVNVPGRYLTVPRLSEKDLSVLEFSIANRVEEVALSFSRDYEDVRNLYSKMDAIASRMGSDHMPRIIAKIEDEWGIRNLYDMIGKSRDAGIDMGVMVARGDLAVEKPVEMLPFLQESIVGACRSEGTYCVTATDLLESMQYEVQPKRSEVCDVYNAIRCGSDALLLSAETSNGVDPVNATQSLSYLIRTYARKFGA